MNDSSRPSASSGLAGENNRLLVDIEIASEPTLDTASATIAVAAPASRPSQRLRGKHAVFLTIVSVLAFFGYERLAVAPENRLSPPGATDRLLGWVEAHPRAGVLVLVLSMTLGPLLLVPVTGPLGMGIGYVYTAVYGWSVGYPLATAVMYCGTVAGACACFLAGRYLVRDHVRRWIRGNPMLEAVDIASAESGFKMMAMLELAPLPIGPLCYVCGTTSMTFTAFCLAKIFALPRTLLVVFAGASTATMLGGGGNIEDEAAQNQNLMFMGLVLAGVAIGLLGNNIRKELKRILERQRHQTHDFNLEMESLCGSER